MLASICSTNEMEIAMRNKLRNTLILLVFAICCLTAPTAFSQRQNKNHAQSKRVTAPRGVPLWEYKITGPITQEDINKLGAEGWELAAATAYPDNAALYFKRRKR